MAQSTIVQIEDNPEKERLPKVISKLARALGISPDDLKRPPGEGAAPRVEEFQARTTGPVSREEFEALNKQLDSVIREIELLRLERELRDRLEGKK